MRIKSAAVPVYIQRHAMCTSWPKDQHHARSAAVTQAHATQIARNTKSGAMQGKKNWIRSTKSERRTVSPMTELGKQ